MSSSSDSQRNARPWSRSVTLARSSGEARASKGNLSAGKLSMRWSDSSNQTRRPSIQHRTAIALDCALSSMKTKVGGGQGLAIFLYVSANLVKFRRPEAMVGCDRYRLQPELRLDIIAGYVNVRWLIVFPAVEMKPVRADAEHGGHGVNEVRGRRINLRSSSCLKSKRPAPPFQGHRWIAHPTFRGLD